MPSYFEPLSETISSSDAAGDSGSSTYLGACTDTLGTADVMGAALSVTTGAADSLATVDVVQRVILDSLADVVLAQDAATGRRVGAAAIADSLLASDSFGTRGVWVAVPPPAALAWE